MTCERSAQGGRVVAERRAVLPAGPEGAGAARIAARAALSEWGLADLAGDMALAASELAANACVHGAPPVELRLALEDRRSGQALVCEVSDAGAAMPGLTAAPPGAEHGRGLAVVTALAEAFGVRPHARGKTVWFRAGVPAPARGRQVAA